MGLNQNQLVYLIFIFLIFGIGFNSYLDIQNISKSKKMSPYWFWSLAFIMISDISAFIMPFGINILAIPFNISFLAALITLVLLFKSWNGPVSKKLIYNAILLTAIFGIAFTYILFNFQYIHRVFFITSSATFLLAAQFYELLKLRTKEKSIHINFLLGIIAFSAVLAIARFIFAIQASSVDTNIKYFYQESEKSQLARFIFSCSLLLIYIFISNYFYLRLLNNEKKALKKIKNQSTMLDLSNSEKKKLATLLSEREAMISSILNSNKLASTGALSASIAHELNQPLGAIQLNSQFLQMHLKAGKNNSEDLKKSIDRIIDDNKRASGIVSSLRNIFSNKEVGYSALNINEIIHSTLSLVNLDRKNIKIKITTNLSSRSFVYVNTDQLRQVFLNLINNSIEALRKSKKTNKTIHISTCDKKEFVQIDFQDNGPGVNKEIQSDLFNLLKTNKKTGLGVGLWLSRYIVERNKGEVKFKNATKGGALFTITLPALKARKTKI